MNIVEVKFGNDNFSFFYNKIANVSKNITVIVNTEKGYMFGKIVKVLDDSSYEDFLGLNLYDVIRVASRKDYYQHLDNIKAIDYALNKCRELVKKNNLNMNILDGQYNFDRTQLLFRFVAEERVDFRQLAKELGSFFKTRIELRQIGIRDKAKEIGGIGPCGLALCCTTFLKEFDSITINMAKNQGVSLNPSKINGVCGRLLCCLKYENEIYKELRVKVPKIGSKVVYNGKSGKVVLSDIFSGKYKIEFDDKSRIEVDINES